MRQQKREVVAEKPPAMKVSKSRLTTPDSDDELDIEDNRSCAKGTGDVESAASRMSVSGVRMSEMSDYSDDDEMACVIS